MPAFHGRLTGGTQVHRRLAALLKAAGGESLKRAAVAGAIPMQNRWKELCAVETGTYRRSVHIGGVTRPEGGGDDSHVKEREDVPKPEESMTRVVVTIGTDIVDPPYPCIFDGETRVRTRTGRGEIGRLVAGDEVMTQTGEYRRVTARASFPATEKPDVITITAPWRAGRDHQLTVTLDHQMLVRRGPRNLWVMAGDLRPDDLLYHRRKINPDKGHRQLGSRRDFKTCEQCGTRHQGQGRRYCSLPCRDRAYAAGANPHLGMKRSDETRARLAALASGRGAGITMNRTLAARGYITDAERKVEAWLVERGVAYERQAQIGGHVVDFLLASGEVVEADGAYWHQDQARDIERDRDLLAALPGFEITHIHFYDSRFTPIIDPEPLPGVRYVVCNPGPSSFVDPVAFEAVPIAALRQWRYQPTRRWQVAKHYDLQVEGVHSFLASGLLVSNTFLEYGTAHMGAQPAAQPAFDETQEHSKHEMEAVLKLEFERAARL